MGEDRAERQTKQFLIASKNMSASQDNKKLLNDLDAIYSENVCPTGMHDFVSGKDGPLPHEIALATSNSTKVINL